MLNHYSEIASKFQSQKRLEADRLRQVEEKELEKSLGKAKAKEEAERLHRVSVIMLPSLGYV